jgi:hypothetical protein
VRARSNVSRFPRWLVTFLEAWLRWMASRPPSKSLKLTN